MNSVSLPCIFCGFRLLKHLLHPGTSPPTALACAEDSELLLEKSKTLPPYQSLSASLPILTLPQLHSKDHKAFTVMLNLSFKLYDINKFQQKIRKRVLLEKSFQCEVINVVFPINYQLMEEKTIHGQRELMWRPHIHVSFSVSDLFQKA